MEGDVSPLTFMRISTLKGSQFLIWSIFATPPMSLYAAVLSAPSESSLFFVRVFQTGPSCAVERWLRPALWIALVLTLGNVECLLRSVLYAQYHPDVAYTHTNQTHAYIDTHTFTHTKVFILQHPPIDSGTRFKFDFSEFPLHLITSHPPKDKRYCSDMLFIEFSATVYKSCLSIV